MSEIYPQTHRNTGSLAMVEHADDEGAQRCCDDKFICAAAQQSGGDQPADGKEGRHMFKRAGGGAYC